MTDILSLSIASSPAELRPLRDATTVRLAHYGIVDEDAELIVCLVNELVSLAFAAAVGRLRVTVDVDMGVARVGVVDECAATHAQSRHRHPSTAPWFAFIDALADSWGMSIHLGRTYLWAERPIVS